MKQFKLFIELIRLDKPIGYMLLFWPCAWGLTLAYDFNTGLKIYFFYLTLFFLGSVLMRSAGCIINDIADKNFDKKVFRTKNRPIASGRISINSAYFYSATLCFIAFLILLNFNNFTIFLALGSMPLAFLYPYMKRFTYWPQLFLGITFNYGILIGWASINSEINLISLIMYSGAIFWTLAYDTIYGFQDIKDDEIIGLKSTSIKFKKNPYYFLILCYSTFSISLIFIGVIMNFSLFYFIFTMIAFFHLFYLQLNKLNILLPDSCLKIFRSNNSLGLIILINLIIGKFLL